MEQDTQNDPKKQKLQLEQLKLCMPEILRIITDKMPYSRVVHPAMLKLQPGKSTLILAITDEQAEKLMKLNLSKV